MPTSAPTHRLLTRRARAARMLLAVLALLAAAAIPAHAEPGPDGGQPPAEPKISFQRPEGGVPRTLSWSQLEGRAIDRNYTLPDGSTQTLRGVLLADVLGAAHIALSNFTLLGMTREDGNEMSVLFTQVGRDADAFVYLDPSGRLALLRPALAGERRSERALAGEDGVLNVRMIAEDTLVATPETAYVGDEVAFTVSYPSGPVRSAVEFEWLFNDETPMVVNRKDRMTHVFRRAGVFAVSVFYRVDGSRRDSMPVVANVTVMPKPRRDGDGNARKSDDSGRRRASGGDRGDAGDGSGGGTGNGDGDYGATGGGGAGGWDGTTPPAASTPPPAQPRPPARRAPQKPSAPQQPAGETIDGYLLASADEPLPTGGGVRALDEVKRPVTDPDGPLHVPTVVWVALGLLALVVLGWTLESRTTLPYFKP